MPGAPRASTLWIPSILTLVSAILLCGMPVSAGGDDVGIGGVWKDEERTGHYRASIQSDGVLVEWITSDAGNEEVYASTKLGGLSPGAWQLSNPELRPMGSHTELYISALRPDSGEVGLFSARLGAPGIAASLTRTAR